MYIKLPHEVDFIIDKLHESGFEGYIVGGCVRDSLLNRRPRDYDICTNATPKDNINIFSKLCTVVPTGIKHGTITLIINEQQFEITTYRIDGLYSDNRRPDTVSYTGLLVEDLKRRDFTINAMAYNKDDGLIDPSNGRGALKKRVITCVGNAYDRMNEDYLRALRAVRFSCQLDFNLDAETATAIEANKDLIVKISMERIRYELCEILTTKKASWGIKCLEEFGLLEHIIPMPYKYAFIHNLKSLDCAPQDVVVRLAILLYDTGSHAASILKRLKFDRDTITGVCTLIDNPITNFSMSEVEAKKMISRVGIRNIDNLFEVQIALARGSAGELNLLDSILKLKKLFFNILNKRYPLNIKDLKINGKDLINLGYSQGAEIGTILRNLLELVLENPELNNRDELIWIVNNMH